MLNALLDKKRVCSLDIKNIYGVKDYTVEKNLRDASRQNKLRCEDCGSLLYLKSGYIKVPHFAHKNIQRNCESYKRDSIESENHRMGVHYIYTYLKDNWPSAQIEVDYRFENNRRANLYIDNNGEKLAIEYVYKLMDYKSWMDRNNDYNKLGINSVWILSDNELKNQILNGYDFFQKTMNMYSADGIIRFFDYKNSEVTFLKYLEYTIDNQVYKRSSLSKSYNTSQLDASLDGLFSTADFISYYNQEKVKFDIDADNDYKRKNALDKVLKEEQLKLNGIAKLENERKEKTKNDKLNRAKQYAKTEDDYCEEALEARENNPLGPWYDSRGTERWAICVVCGSFTNEWWHCNSKNECRCYCDQEDR